MLSLLAVPRMVLYPIVARAKVKPEPVILPCCCKVNIICCPNSPTVLRFFPNSSIQAAPLVGLAVYWVFNNWIVLLTSNSNVSVVAFQVSPILSYKSLNWVCASSWFFIYCISLSNIAFRMGADPPWGLGSGVPQHQIPTKLWPIKASRTSTLRASIRWP